MSPDLSAEIALDARVGVGAMHLANGKTTEAEVLAELVAIVPGRPDLVDSVVAKWERARTLPDRVADWPPAGLVLELLAKVRAAVEPGAAHR